MPADRRDPQNEPTERSGGPASGTVPRLYQQAFDMLARQIGQGTLAEGTRLTESGVAAQFGISRAPARRALAELQRSGLVGKADGRGYLVRRVDGGAADGAPAPAGADALQLSPPSSWERIYGEVEGQIVARIACASWRVNEAEMARHYGVSRTVARDVLGRLQQQGVIRKDERSRWYAPALTPQHVGELYELRWLLEPVALTKAAPRVPRRFVAAMRTHLEDAIAHAHALQGATLDALETEMHVTLLEHCGNRTLMQAITLQQSLLIAHRFLYRWTPELFESEPFLPEHLEIVARLEDGRPEAAAESLEWHLRVSRERALARVDVIVRDFEPEGLSYLERLEPG